MDIKSEGMRTTTSYINASDHLFGSSPQPTAQRYENAYRLTGVEGSSWPAVSQIVHQRGGILDIGEQMKTPELAISFARDVEALTYCASRVPAKSAEMGADTERHG
ncbi:Molybdopterin oxidoreductase [Lasiodiplodia theobromae]|uniref:Molybdopterin oxidoreductase n=1 Tax=Lasiodiplodia theobromae TaxID=45133 RepID=UPI0015C3C661|nr:Molybdopterin oxidoreductase [Lasiodiplodia theobromae]KAF4541539.1 Molybdopterin oxidoreductase [Lasiodiplodia theobromae]